MQGKVLYLSFISFGEITGLNDFNISKAFVTYCQGAFQKV
jgi:hypothetical protein